MSDHSSRHPLARTRWAAIGAAVAVTLGAGGLFTAHAASDGPASVFVATTPCRLLDTRSSDPIGARAIPVDAGETIEVQARGVNGNCTIPADATTLVLNVTATNTSEASYLTLHAAGIERPATSNVNWTSGGITVANAATVNLSADGLIAISNEAGTVDVIVDVVGFYSTAPLDDFYTKADVDALLAASPGGVGTVGPAGPQGETGATGLAGEPGAAGDSLLGELACDAGAALVFDGIDWVCQGPTVVASMSRQAFGGYCCGFDTLYSARSPSIVGDPSCDYVSCRVSIVGVADHNTCVGTFLSGVDSPASGMSFTTTASTVEFYGADTADYTQALHIMFACSAD